MTLYKSKMIGYQFERTQFVYPIWLSILAIFNAQVTKKPNW